MALMLALALVLVLAHEHTRFARRQSVTTAIVTAHAAACTAALASTTLVGTTISNSTHAVASQPWWAVLRFGHKLTLRNFSKLEMYLGDFRDCINSDMIWLPCVD